jgi:hypothetical protein
VKKFVSIIVQLFVAFLFLSEEAKSADKATCKNFQIAFEENIKDLPSFVYANGEKIGIVVPPNADTGNAQTVTTCIDNTYAGRFEKNSLCYVSKDQIVIYNVWSTGVDLKEGDSVKGFASRSKLYIYEAKEFFTLGKEAVMAYIFKWIGQTAIDGPISKAKDIYGVFAK